MPHRRTTFPRLHPRTGRRRPYGRPASETVRTQRLRAFGTGSCDRNRPGEADDRPVSHCRRNGRRRARSHHRTDRPRPSHRTHTTGAGAPRWLVRPARASAALSPPQPPGAPPTPPPWSPAPPWSPPPPPPKRSSHKPLILIGAIAAVVLLVAAGIFATVQLTGHDKPATGAAPTTAAAAAQNFDGTYRADLGPGTDLEDKPAP